MSVIVIGHICREAELEKAPEAEPLLLEGAVQARRHQLQPLIPPAADLYLPVQQQEPHHDHVRRLTSQPLLLHHLARDAAGQDL